MPTTQTQLFPPPVRATTLSEPEQKYLASIQYLMPLRLVDTSSGPYAETLPPAGLDSTTGQSAQNQELIFCKTSADANVFTINGAIDGAHTLTDQYDVLRFKSNGTSWYPSCCSSGSSGSGSFPAGANIVPIQNPTTGASALSGSATSCLITRIPAASHFAIGSKIQVDIQFDAASAGNLILSNSVVRRTLPGDVTFTDTSNLTWSGTTTPTFNTATKNFSSDSSTATLDSLHDTYIILRVNPASGAGVLVNNFQEIPIAKCSGEATGVAYDTVAAIPNLNTLLTFLSAQTELVSRIAIGA